MIYPTAQNISRIRIIFLTGVGISLLLFSTSVQALSQGDINAINQDSVHYKDPGLTSGTCSLDTGGTILQGNDNIEKSWNFFLGKGLTDVQTAGLIGNFMWESGGGTSINPNAENGIGAYGIAQWLGGRKTALQNFAKQQNKAVNDLGVQLNYAWAELRGGESAAYDALVAVKTTGPDGVKIAAQVVMDKYERPGDDTLGVRQQAALDAYTLYAGSSTGTTSGNGTCVGWSGQDTKYIDGFTVYSQCDPDWGNNPYGKGTTNICNSGCGPTAMAMIITNLTGERVTPDKTAEYADSINQYKPGVGSSHSVGPLLAKHWGLKSKKLSNSITQINNALASDQLVIVAGDGAEPFTSAGHFIVIRAVTSTGKWRVGDSAHSDTSTKDWDPAAIIAGVKGHESSVYAVYK